MLGSHHNPLQALEEPLVLQISTGSCLLTCYAYPWTSLWGLTQRLSGKCK